MRKLATERTLKLSDFVLAALIGLVALAFLAVQGNRQPSSTDCAVIVEVSGKETHTIPFSEVSGLQVLKMHFGVDQWATLEILENGSGSGQVRIEESSCPDKVCVKTGWISRPGQAIVCLPHRIVVRIEGGGKISHDSESNLDAITY
jgi:hypothetical protein